MLEDLEVITAGIPKSDDCPILTKINAFLVSQGVCNTLEFTFRDRNGVPVNLGRYLASSVSESASTSTATDAAAVVKVRVKEFDAVGINDRRNPIWELTGESPDPENGVLRVKLEASLVEHAGVYQMDWGIVGTSGTPFGIRQSLLSVERSLFPQSTETLYKNLGPPTIGEIRNALMDSGAENLLLDDVEFSDANILHAIVEPIRIWNMTPPPIATFTTRDFPYRAAMMSGIIGELHITAANYYRRNFLQSQAGGITVLDKGKEKEYLAEGQRRKDEYKEWVLNKKVELNMKSFNASVTSRYSSRNGW